MPIDASCSATRSIGRPPTGSTLVCTCKSNLSNSWGFSASGVACLAGPMCFYAAFLVAFWSKPRIAPHAEIATAPLPRFLFISCIAPSLTRASSDLVQGEEMLK
jgi:hypothetical protein